MQCIHVHTGIPFAHSSKRRQVSVYGTLDSTALIGFPNVRFTIDDDSSTTSTFNQTGTLPANVTTALSHVLLYQSPLLSQRAHTISIVLEPSSFNGSGLPPTFYFDFFTIATECLSPFSNLIVDDKDPSMEYTGGHTDVRNGSEYMGTEAMLTTVDGLVKFRFQGKSWCSFFCCTGLSDPHLPPSMPYTQGRASQYMGCHPHRIPLCSGVPSPPPPPACSLQSMADRRTRGYS